MNYLIFLYILSLSQEFISVHFNYPFFGIKNKNPTKHYAFAFISTISLYCLHKLLAYVLPGSWCFCAISNTFSKLLNIHAVCEDSCCLILQIHGYSHSCILNCITILYSSHSSVSRRTPTRCDIYISKRSTSSFDRFLFISMPTTTPKSANAVSSLWHLWQRTSE